MPCYECAFRRWLLALDFHHGLLGASIDFAVRSLVEEGQDAEMTQKLLMLLVVSVLAIGPGLSFTSAAQENSVIIRPGYKKGQQSRSACTMFSCHRE